MLGTCYKKTGTCSKISRSGNIMKDWLKGYPRFSSVQFHSVTQSCPTLCNPMNPPGQASISITHSRSSPILMSIELVMPSNHLILCCPLLSFQTSGSFQMSQLFSHQVAKILKFQLQHQSFQWTPRTDLLFCCFKSFVGIVLTRNKLMLTNCGVGEDSWESLGQQRDPMSPS